MLARMTARDAELHQPDHVRAAILAAVSPLPPRPVAVADAAGLVLAEDLVAGFDLPPFAAAAMDGFAVRSNDLAPGATRLTIVGPSLAGRPWSGSVRTGQAASVATGAMIPQGADVVIPLEEAEANDEATVTVRGPVAAGRHVRRAGEDAPGGTLIVRAGEVLGPGQLVAASAVGRTTLLVLPRPVVAVLPTGDEVRSGGTGLSAGQVYDAISAPVAALIRDAGGEPRTHAAAPDHPRALLTALRHAASEADAVVTTGGVSEGTRDLVGRLADSSIVGVEVQRFRVAIRPGRPFAFGRAFGVPLFGLPGNPGAALVAFEEFVRPAILALRGRPGVTRREVEAELVTGIPRAPDRTSLLPCRAWLDQGRLSVRTLGRGAITSLAASNGWVVVPAGEGELPAGSTVRVRLLFEPDDAAPP
jgi:molybdopterin molybdotransferase